MTEVRSWEESNQACLVAELAEVRAALAKLLSPAEAEASTISQTEAARSALECGGSTPPSVSSCGDLDSGKGGVEPPHSKAPSAHGDSAAHETAWSPSAWEQIRASMSAPPAIDTLCATLGLTPFERRILLLCGGVELDSGFAGLCARANSDARSPLPTFSLALAAFDEAHWSALLPSRPLRFWRLIELAAGDSLTTSPLRIDERILHYLAGMPAIDERLRGLTKPVAAVSDRRNVDPRSTLQSQSGGLPASQRAVAERIATAWSRAATESQWPAVQLCGIDLAGKRAVAAAACALLGLRLRSLPSHAVPRAIADLDLFIRLWEREAALDSTALLLETDDAETTDTQGDAALKRLVESLNGPLLISTRELQKPVERRILSFEVPGATSTEQLAIWKETLGPAAAALDGRVETLVSQFNLSPGVIQAVVAQAIPNGGTENGREYARSALECGGWTPPLHQPTSSNDGTEGGVQPPDVAVGAGLALPTGTPRGAPTITSSEDRLAAALWDACRIQARPRLEGLAQRLEPFATWDDLVLPDAQKKLLRQIALQVRQRSKVYQTWGFASKGSRGLGISALFAGPSGTGKTMAGEVLAGELRLDLYRIDLSQVVSKYIGETEKNLRRVFDAAEGGAAILLFDEADALFGKRSEVKDSHDRYANIEVGYLLQRMEAYRGLAILTTNRKEALDHAFLRRIRFVVEFPFPAAAQRAEIWRRVFPRQTPTEGLHIERLARLSATGGNIYNIAMGAAFLAADAGEPVRMPHLLAAARSEFAKLEYPLTEAETAGWV